jgi:hypothetical protein
MAWERIEYKREDLFDQVWAEPMVHVAKRMGISDVALASVDTSKPAICGRVKTGHFGWRPGPVECLVRSLFLP